MKSIFSILILALFISSTACKRNKDKAVEPSTGSISGKVKLYTPDGKLYTGSLSNVTVGIASADIYTATDNSGTYTLSNVPAGVYDISFSAPDGTSKMNNQVVFPGNGNLIVNENIVFASTETMSVRCYDSTSAGKKGIWIRVLIQNPSANATNNVLLCFSNSANISPLNLSNCPYYTGIYLQKQIPNGALVANVFDQYDLIKSYANFSSNQTFFVNVFSDPSTAYSTYYNPYNESTVHYAAGKASTAPFEFVMP